MAAMFLWVCAQFYIPGQGFTDLIMFGDKMSAHYLPELRATDYHLEKDSYGYDAQYYAQIAMHPRLGDPVLRKAVDSLPYRARRILFCWTAYALGGGNPVAALHVFAVQNIIAWLLLGWVLLRWFPPRGLQDFLRWVAVMFTCGICFSVRAALVDGPSLLLIATGMALLEAGRPWWSAAVMGIAGLGKETNIMAATALAPADWRDRRGWVRAIARGLLVVAPLGVWLVCLKLWLGTGGDVGARNFNWPFVGYVHKWREVLQGFGAQGSGQVARDGVLMLVATSVQWLYFALRPRWRDPWWRLGAVYALLMVVLGDAVWEGYPGAAWRVLLPMTLAFNVTLPRGRRWWALLVLGNLLVWPSAHLFVPPGHDAAAIRGPQRLKVAAATDRDVAVVFPTRDWFGVERSYFDYWRWARGPATLILRNPHAYPLIADVTFELKSTEPRHVTVRSGERVLWSGPVARDTRKVTVRNLRLPPGDTAWRFDTDRPAVSPGNGDPRLVAYRVCNFELTLVGSLPRS